MNLQLSLIELVVADMAATLAFYRRLGLDIPAGADQQPHVDIEIKGGLRIAFDTEDTIRSFDSGWTRPSGGSSIRRRPDALVLTRALVPRCAWASAPPFTLTTDTPS